MPKIQMEVIPEPKQGAAAVLTRSTVAFASKNPYAVFAGKGNTDYVCGACKAALAVGVERGVLVNIVLRCPACKSFNAVRGS